MTLLVNIGEKARYFNDLVSEFQFIGTQARANLYRAALRPWVWFLSRSINCRIFQHQSVIDIIEEVVRPRASTELEILAKPREPREFVVQYREADLEESAGYWSDDVGAAHAAKKRPHDDRRHPNSLDARSAGELLHRQVPRRLSRARLKPENPLAAERRTERGRMTFVGRGSLVFAVAMNSMLAACQCEVRSAEPEAPPRPSGVHAKAVWAGGVDGGDFILLVPTKPAGTYAAKIYNDHSGDLEFNGKLRLKEPSHAPIDVNDPTTFSGWDGESLFLRDGRTLRPAE